MTYYPAMDAFRVESDMNYPPQFIPRSQIASFQPVDEEAMFTAFDVSHGDPKAKKTK